jgi:hypothetical protein
MFGRFQAALVFVQGNRMYADTVHFISYSAGAMVLRGQHP